MKAYLNGVQVHVFQPSYLYRRVFHSWAIIGQRHALRRPQNLEVYPIIPKVMTIQTYKFNQSSSASYYRQ